MLMSCRLFRMCVQHLHTALQLSRVLPPLPCKPVCSQYAFHGPVCEPARWAGLSAVDIDTQVRIPVMRPFPRTLGPVVQVLLERVVMRTPAQDHLR